MRVLPVPVPDEQIEEMYKVADVNGDGAISLEEFHNMVLIYRKLTIFITETVFLKKKVRSQQSNSCYVCFSIVFD